MRELTDRQKEILLFVIQFRDTHGRTPSGPEIADHFGYSHPSSAYEHLRLIEKKGYLTVTQPSRSGALQIRPTEKAARFVSDGIPLLGRIPAGPVTETGEEKTYVESIQDLLPMMKSEDYLLTVEGDSMREAGIEEGMTALIRPSVEPTDGDICAVWIDGDGGTLKRVYRHGETIQLLPENDHYDPMEVSTERVRIQGVLVAVFSIQTFRRH